MDTGRSVADLCLHGSRSGEAVLPRFYGESAWCWADAPVIGSGGTFPPDVHGGTGRQVKEHECIQEVEHRHVGDAVEPGSRSI